MTLTKWQYMKLYVPDEDFEETLERLNELGEAGWELVGSPIDTSYGQRYFMKRNKEWEAHDNHAN